MKTAIATALRGIIKFFRWLDALFPEVLILSPDNLKRARESGRPYRLISGKILIYPAAKEAASAEGREVSPPKKSPAKTRTLIRH